MAKLKDTEITGALKASGSITSNVPGAGLASIGTVKLNNSINSTSDSEAATPSAVKQVKDIVDKKENSFSKNSAFNRNYEANAAAFKVAGTASAGSSDTTARADHIHPAQTTISGNAGSATKLATPRSIALSGDATGSVNFDGTANVSIPVAIVDNSHNHTTLESGNSGTMFKDHGNGNVTISAAKDASGNIGDLYIGYNTSSHFTKNVRLESPVNWKGSANYIIDSNGKIDWSNLKNVPSAQVLGAVPLTGGTMTGSLTTTSLTVNGSDKQASFGVGPSDAYIRNVKSNKYLQLRDDGQVAYDGKLIYHEGKKPTPTEIGSLALVGGAMTGSISSSLTSSTYLNANKGGAIINSTATGNGFNMLASMGSTNGRWLLGSYGTSFNLYHTANSTIEAGTNGTTKTLTLLNETGNSIFPGDISATTANFTSSNATPLILRRTGTNANLNIGFDGNGTIKYLGCPKGELKFGSAEDLGSQGSTVWHEGNFNPDNKISNTAGDQNVANSWRVKHGNAWIGYGLYGSQDCGIVSNDRAVVLGGTNPWFKYNNYYEGGDKFYTNERAHQFYGDNLSLRMRSSTAPGAVGETVSWTNPSHVAGVVWSSSAPSSNNYTIGTIWVQY